MTPRERWLAVLKGQKPDRVPMDYWATGEATRKLINHLKCNSQEELFKRLHIDRVITVEPRYTGPSLPEDTDIFGCRFQNVSYGRGVYQECIYHPLAKYRTVEEIKESCRWPSPDWYDYSEIPHQIIGREDYPICGGGSEPFLTYMNLRGQEQALIDLILAPEMVHFCLDKLFDLCYENTLRIYEAISDKVMITYVTEDLGSQEDLMYSPEQIREFFIPRMKRTMDLAHQAGTFVFHHSDGAIRKIIPEMIKAGIDVLNPIQWRCKGMEREALKRDFGNKIVFHGGMDNQYTLAFGSKEEVRQEVVDNLRILGKGGGYILSSAKDIQPETPTENAVAVIEAFAEQAGIPM